MQKKNLIKLARSSQPHGLRGEVSLNLMNPDHEESILKPGLKVWLFPKMDQTHLQKDVSRVKESTLSKEGEQWVIEKMRWGRKVLCLLKGIEDRTHLEKLLPFEIYLEREFFPAPQEGEVYLVDLIGAEVWEFDAREHADFHDSQKKRVGTLKRFAHNGAQIILLIQTDEGEEILLPFIDQFVPLVKESEKKIFVNLPNYLD